MKIVIYKENKPEKGDEDYLIKFPKETSVISLDPTIQILFVMDKDISDTKKIIGVCRPWNYVRRVVYEGKRSDYLIHYDKISEYQPMEGSFLCNPATFNTHPLYFEEPELKGNKDIELIKNNIPQGILPYYAFGKSNGRIYGGFRRKGWFDIWIGKDKVKLVYNRKLNLGNNPKGYYIYTFKTVSEALPEINKIIGKMGYV